MINEELTQKLKQGNLKDGYYYAKMPTGCVDVVSLYNLRQLRLVKDVDKIEVLSPVPSFNEYISLINWKEDLTELCTAKERIIEKYENIDTWWQAEYTELKEENEKLKKQLEMLLNPKNVTENVANQKMQHCESQTNLHTTDE